MTIFCFSCTRFAFENNNLNKLEKHCLNIKLGGFDDFTPRWKVVVTANMWTCFWIKCQQGDNFFFQITACTSCIELDFLSMVHYDKR